MRIKWAPGPHAGIMHMRPGQSRANLGMAMRQGQVRANLGMTTVHLLYKTHLSLFVCPSDGTCSPLTRLCFCLAPRTTPHQEGPGRDDLRTQATEVLPGDAGWEIGGPEPEAGGAAGKNQPPRPQRQEPSAGTGDQAEGGEREGGRLGGLLEDRQGPQTSQVPGARQRSPTKHCARRSAQTGTGVCVRAPPPLLVRCPNLGRLPSLCACLLLCKAAVGCTSLPGHVGPG